MGIEVITGDALEAVTTLPPASVDCIITDPPYGETSLAWDRWIENWPQAMFDVLKPSGSMWVFGSQRMFLDRIAEFAGWHFAQDIVWEKHNGSGLHSDRFRRVHELALHFYPKRSKWSEIYREPQFTLDAMSKRVVRKKGRPAHWHGSTGESLYTTKDGGPRLMRSVIYHRSEHHSAVHPTQKPLGILEPLLRYSCPPGGTVLDPFAGSGSTGLIAKIHNRNAILIEIDPKFVSATEARIRDDAPLLAGLET